MTDAPKQETKEEPKEQKKEKIPKTKHFCGCNKKFRHRYLVVRHIRLLTHAICPKCFMPLKVYSNEHGDTLDCPGCYYKEFFPPGTLGAINEKSRQRHFLSYYPGAPSEVK